MATATTEPNQAKSNQPLIFAAIVIIVGVLGTTLSQFQLIGLIPLKNLLKNELHAGRASTAAFFFWIQFAWYFKPFAGPIYRELCRRGMSEVINSIDADSFLVEELTRLRMPVSIIWGKEDGVISQETISVLAKFVPHAAVEFIDRCGHVPQLERPDRFVDALEKLLDGGKR